MPTYKRHFVPGDLQFLTSSTYRRTNLLESDRPLAAELRSAPAGGQLQCLRDRDIPRLSRRAYTTTRDRRVAQASFLDVWDMQGHRCSDIPAMPRQEKSLRPLPLQSCRNCRGAPPSSFSKTYATPARAGWALPDPGRAGSATVRDFSIDIPHTSAPSSPDCVSSPTTFSCLAPATYGLPPTVRGAPWNILRGAPPCSCNRAGWVYADL